MTKNREIPPKANAREGAAERVTRFGRNVNILGALVLAGASIAIPGPNIILSSWAGINALQAGGFELLRNRAEKSRKRKTKT